MLVRAFSNEKLEEREAHLNDVVAKVNKRFPKAKITIKIDESYRNMAYKIREDSKVLDYALEAVERIGVTPIRQAIRGGTDGATAVLHGSAHSQRLGRWPELPLGQRVGLARVDDQSSRGNAGDSDGLGGEVRIDYEL